MSTVATLLKTKGYDILTVTPDASVRDTVSKMNDLSVGTALVTDHEKVVGIVSERDVIRKVILENKDISSVTARDIMTTDLAVVSAETSIEDCMTQMTTKRIRHLPVLCGEKLCGIVSIGDVVKFLASEQEFQIKNLESYITGTM
jgi:CBS domain-containing protein